MEKYKIRIKEQDLVLKISKNINNERWNESKYDNFILKLTNGRKYQEEAIYSALRYMCGGQYRNLEDLAKENFSNNQNLQEKYLSEKSFLDKLNFKDSFTANLDLATGTGKSWILYAIARIMLAENIVDQVLILVPSITIERELTEKFKKFASDRVLNDAISYYPPQIIKGNDSIVKNCICIENRDSIYKNSRSSIVDSLLFKGDKTLILCDEVHHVYYSEENEWKKFIKLINPKYFLGVSGTCYYRDNDYFTDVIYRYSLKKAIEDGWIKNVSYVVKENMPSKIEEKWQVIINSHNEIKDKLSKNNILPISIVVVDKTSTCDAIAKQFKELLKKINNLTDDEVNEKVIVVHSKANVAGDRLKLKTIDDNSSKVEWIFSVSMLTEGWDVKRVFQIIPHEERAFNSKLLIAQVLGRGLRIPDNWVVNQFGRPEVIVFNHEKWASGVKKLVDEVLEIERHLTTTTLEDSPFNFNLVNCDYKKDLVAVKRQKNKTGLYNLFEKGYVCLPSVLEKDTIEIELSNLKSESKQWKTEVVHNTISIDDMALKMWDRFNDIPDDNNEGLAEQYQAKYTVEKLKEIIIKSLELRGNKIITDQLSNKFLSAMSTAWRQGQSYVTYVTSPNTYNELYTKDMRRETINASSLKKNATLFWDDNTKKYLSEEEKEFFNEIIDSSNGYRQYKIDNINDFKTPSSFCFSLSEPEKIFMKKLIENSKFFNSWIKAPSTGFYSIDFSWKKNPRHGEAIRYEKFNPDFFINIDDKILVVEIKGDEEISNPQPENLGKYIAGIDHFNLINKYCNNKYKFTMLTPRSFDAFFDRIKNGGIDKFSSELDVELERLR